MKKISIIVCIAFLAMSAFVARDHFKSGIQGTIDPPEGARKVWAINGADTSSALPVNGKFALELAPGNWKIIVEATPPYKNAIVENIPVKEGQSTDAGVIKLTSE